MLPLLGIKGGLPVGAVALRSDQVHGQAAVAAAAAAGKGGFLAAGAVSLGSGEFQGQAAAAAAAAGTRGFLAAGAVSQVSGKEHWIGLLAAETGAPCLGNHRASPKAVDS